MPISNQSFQNPPAAPIGIVQALARHAPVVIGLLLLALAGAGAYVFLLPKTYTAVARVHVRPFAGGSGAAPTTGPSDERDALVAAQAPVVTSAAVLNLADSYAANAKISFLARQADPVRFLKRELRVNARASVLAIALSGSDPDQLERVVDVVVDAYRAYQKTANQERAQAELAEADAQTRSAEIRLAEVRGLIDALLREDPLLRLEAAQSPAAIKVSTLGDELVKAQRATLETRARYDAVLAGGGEQFARLTEQELSDALAAEGMPSGRAAVDEEVNRQQQRLTELRRTYLPNHPSVVRATNRLRQLKVVQLAAARDAWKTAERYEASTASALTDAQKSAAVSSERAGQLASLSAEQRRLEARLEALASSREGALSKVAGIVDVERIHPATTSDPGFPPTPRSDPTALAFTLGIAGLLGLALGVGGALLMEWRSAGTMRHAMPLAGSRSVRPQAESLGLPVLTSVPPIDEPGGTVALAWAGQIDAQGKMARAIRVLRRAVEIQGQLPATLAFTSPQRGAGKTSVAVNLAAVIAREGRKVLLIDLSFDSPGISQVFSLKERRGMTELLRGAAEAAEVVQNTSVPNLDALALGESNDIDAVSLLNGPRFAELVSVLTAAYDHLIFDCDATSGGDAARIVASLADATVLVSRARSAGGARAIADSRDALMTLGAHVMGLVLTHDAQQERRTLSSIPEELEVPARMDDASGFFRNAAEAGGTGESATEKAASRREG